MFDSFFVLPFLFIWNMSVLSHFRCALIAFLIDLENIWLTSLVLFPLLRVLSSQTWWVLFHLSFAFISHCWLYTKSIVNIVFMFLWARILFFIFQLVAWLELLTNFSWKIWICTKPLRIIIWRTWLPNYFESFNLGLVKINFWGHFYIISEGVHEKMRKRTTKVCSIKVSGCLNTTTIIRFPFLNHINFFTLWAIVLNSTTPKFLT